MSRPVNLVLSTLVLAAAVSVFLHIQSTFSLSQKRTYDRGGSAAAERARVIPITLPLEHIDADGELRLRPLAGGSELGFRRLPQGTMLNVSLCLHFIKTNGLDVAVRLGESTEPVRLIDVLTIDTHGKEYLGRPAFVRTRSGLRFTTRRLESQTRSDESHRDLSLSMFAELGVPLSQELIIDGESFQLRDVLRDSLAEFHLSQDEIAWTALAYALYLPPISEWTNRYGEKYNFDLIVKNLLARDHSKASCEGTHLLYALCAIARVNERHSLLSGAVERELRAHLEHSVRCAVETQGADGSWHPGWGRVFETKHARRGWHPEDTPEGRLLVTSHLAEYILRLPDSLRPPDRVMAKAATWLESRLEVADEQQMLEQFCPFSHATYVLKSLSDGIGTAPGMSSARDTQG